MKALSETKTSDYILLSDSELAAARALGVAYRVDEETFGKLQGYGIDLEEASGQDHHLLPVPSVFLIDRKGSIRFVYVNPDYTQRIDPETLLAAARAAR